MMFFTIIGYFFVALFIFLLGCIRGECMEKERAEKMLDSGKPFYTKSDGTNIYVQTTMHTTREIKIIGNKFKLKEYPQLYMGNPPLTVGKKYLIKDIDGSYLVFDDDEGNVCRIGSCRFDLT